MRKPTRKRHCARPRAITRTRVLFERAAASRAELELLISFEKLKAEPPPAAIAEKLSRAAFASHFSPLQSNRFDHANAFIFSVRAAPCDLCHICGGVRCAARPRLHYREPAG